MTKQLQYKTQWLYQKILQNIFQCQTSNLTNNLWVTEFREMNACYELSFRALCSLRCAAMSIIVPLYPFCASDLQTRHWNITQKEATRKIVMQICFCISSYKLTVQFSLFWQWRHEQHKSNLSMQISEVKIAKQQVSKWEKKKSHHPSPKNSQNLIN